MNDFDIYGKDEVWAYPHGAGDCEDYVLEKRRDLMLKGISLSDLLITVVRKPDGEGHAVLTVRTDQGDFILDNLNDAVKPWDATGYRYPQAAGDQPYRALGDHPRRQHRAGRLGRLNPYVCTSEMSCPKWRPLKPAYSSRLRQPLAGHAIGNRFGEMDAATVSAPSRSASVRATFSTR